MSLTTRLARAMARLGFELHFFTLTQDRQRVLLFLEAPGLGAVVEGTTMADCIAQLEMEADAAVHHRAGQTRRPGPAAVRGARRGLTVITGGSRPGIQPGPSERI